MAINFPNNRDQLDPPQPSGPLQDGDAFTDAGQTWTWNSGLGVWSTDPNAGADLDALYLSKINDDEAAGAITFRGPTAHQAGISITGTGGGGGLGITQGLTGTDPALATPYIQILAGNALTARFGGGVSYYISAQGDRDLSNATTAGVQSRIKNTGTKLGSSIRHFDAVGNATGPDQLGQETSENVYGFFARNFKDGDTNYGFYSSLSDSGTPKSFAFYAAGAAPSFFAGDIQLKNLEGTEDPAVLGQFDSGSLRVEAPTFRYGFTTDDSINASVWISGVAGAIGMSLAASTANGEYGIHHESNRTISLKNTRGEVRLNTSGTTIFYKDGNSVTINPGNDSASNTVQGSANLAVAKANTTTRITSETVLELQGDDPAAYQTAYAVGDEGEQIEEQQYIGETETLLEIIRDLRARVAALEGA